MPFYATDGSIGIDLETVSSACNYTPGQTVEGSNASEWIYVLANAAISAGGMVGIAASGRATTITGSAISTASSAPSIKFGFAQTAFQASQWGFVAARGQGVLIRLLGGIGPNAAANPLYTTETAGALSTASASATQFQVFGVFIESSVSAVAATAAAVTANLSFPILRKPGLGGG